MFITLEGPDAAGKSTLAHALVEHLVAQKIPVVATREPGGTIAGQKIRHMLLNADLDLTPEAELLLFLADRAQHVHEVIRPALDAGAVVVCDRYGDSTMAYQGWGRGRLADMQPLLPMIHPIVPDLTLILDVDPRVTRARKVGKGVKLDRIEQEAMAFFDAVREGFQAIAKAYPERCRILNASRPEKVVTAEALELVDQALKHTQTQRGAGLWSPAPRCTGV